jgi:uncharacterized protein (TIGR02001 family)
MVWAAGLALFSSVYVTVAIAADISANIGFNSEYIFRGIPQAKHSAFSGFDLESGGFYAGTWAADVGDGYEIDYYGGYGFEASDFGFTAGATWYTYTSDFDDQYLELNLGVNWKILSLEITTGKYANFTGPELDYSFYSISALHNGFFASIGAFGQDFDGGYFEAGYGNTFRVQGHDWFEYMIAAIHSDATLLGDRSDTSYVLSLSRAYDF